MNLPDLIRRKDRAVVFDAGSAEPSTVKVAGRSLRAATIQPGTILRLKDAHEYEFLKDFPTDIHWHLAEGPGVRLMARPHVDGLETVQLSSATSDSPALILNWPLWAAKSGFDLVIEPIGAVPVSIVVGRTLDPRAKMAPLIAGKGLELGPGLTPRITPRAGIEIEYVEEKTPEEWRDVYGRGSATFDALTPDVLSRYRLGSAVTLAEWPADSLDFIFSNHVFEHLMNPLQILRNWLGRLKPGGSLLAVIPDTRFTFDLRQSPSTLEEMRDEERLGGFAVTDDKYHRWCRHTAPYNEIQNLKDRNYSIHVHYYTPLSLATMADVLIESGECSGIFIDTVPNNKEFGVVMVRA